MFCRRFVDDPQNDLQVHLQNIYNYIYTEASNCDGFRCVYIYIEIRIVVITWEYLICNYFECKFAKNGKKIRNFFERGESDLPALAALMLATGLLTKYIDIIKV